MALGESLDTPFWRWRTDVWGILCLAAMWGTAYWIWPDLPEQVPIHWNAEGEITSYGSRSSIWLLPAIASVQWVVFKLVWRRHGAIADLAALGVAAVLGLTFLGVVGTYLGYWSVPLPGNERGSWALGAGVLCLIIGAACWPLQRMEPNPLIGLRTPWTLKSDRSWVRSHRFTGQSSLAVAAALIVPGLLGVPLPWPGVLGLFLAWVALLCWYSYVQWRDDPERE
ncbi:MAG: DUF1648 domain-containing protein [Acidobacteria bacterium]|nr:DUF1648 domain-containing protein [Acidobacteriota bacterium]MXZ72443.1 DUF1648 domain-containing protein [Acidobacteriota bacterium]MYD70220.1 DUF1648 domain-containing protein [Acidobacteriota bacterium]MYJ05809.1 DUF1648 domain-containing protein [Acidobacteriota bacterium]